MKKIALIILSIFLLVVAGCGNKDMGEPITVQNHNGEDVTFPADEPVVFFFMTTYT
ncbi:hypothetical protein JOC85_003447 [Bacillus mesophilus]|uniref:hypothetical protein n=1 Tax=Bacillus mesophilus TaxID=1808955 RepID=UPI0013D77470|nr:hypothetical protein [Bacillus mesophilus]MBM7662637.1 hypothetical protein [Bacillus mesophilus]